MGGLGVEERKRVRIGVELAARPEFLLFLDEPTSVLDSQAAYSMVSFLQRIAELSRLSILCTSGLSLLFGSNRNSCS
jgi:ATP-binding cassette subfamily G (WHITE) protein 2 (SNQ2)